MQKSKPPYAHYAHLPFAREPLKSLYTFQRLLTTLLLVPVWALYYTILPSARPRSSWNLKQVINVLFTRRIYKITEVAGVTWGTHDPDWEPRQGSLKETRFLWVKGLEESMRTGAVQAEGGKVQCRETVGCYVWPKTDPFVGGASPVKGTTPIIGIFMHGGGYCHMSGHEASRTSRVPRRLVKDGIMQEVYSLEYRLLQHAPFPGQLQDAASLYAHVIAYYTSLKQPIKVVLIGDSSGGNLALALARWIRDEGHLRMPDGLLLLSPSCDPSHSFPSSLSSYRPRPHADTDYLTDTPEPHALLQRTFLGFPPRPEGNFPTAANSDLERALDGARPPQMEEEEERLMKVVHSEYVSPCSPRVLERWGHSVAQVEPEGEHAGTSVLPVAEGSGPGKLIDVPSPTDSDFGPFSVHPTSSHKHFSKLFSLFPRTLIPVGDAERLVDEVRTLNMAMRKDGVDVEIMWMRDAVHDVLIMDPSWWDASVIEGTWRRIGEWCGEF